MVMPIIMPVAIDCEGSFIAILAVNCFFFAGMVVDSGDVIWVYGVLDWVLCFCVCECRNRS